VLRTRAKPKGLRGVILLAELNWRLEREISIGVRIGSADDSIDLTRPDLLLKLPGELRMPSSGAGAIGARFHSERPTDRFLADYRLSAADVTAGVRDLLMLDDRGARYLLRVMKEPGLHQERMEIRSAVNETLKENGVSAWRPALWRGHVDIRLTQELQDGLER